MLMPRDGWTSAYMGWTLLQNGQLLMAAEGAGFELLVTADKKSCLSAKLETSKNCLSGFKHAALEHNSEPRGHDLRGDRYCYAGSFAAVAC
jgi:hypothetical protein